MPRGVDSSVYFLRSLADSVCMMPFIVGAAAITFGLSFFGFLVSRFPRCSPLGMVQSSGPGRAIRHNSTTGILTGGAFGIGERLIASEWSFVKDMRNIRGRISGLTTAGVI